MTPIRILLVDDQPLVRSGLRLILSSDEQFVVVGECSDGDEVQAAVELHRPDLVIMDVRMRRVDGAEATRRLRAHQASPPVLILTTFSDDEVLSAALRAGASGFLLKDAPGEEIARAARVVAAGDAYLDTSVTARVLSAYKAVSAEDPEAIQRLQQLTEREIDVLRLIGRGATNSEIAEQLVIGEATVKTHISRIFDKLDLRDRAAAIVFAFDHGLVRPLREVVDPREGHG
jgi:DNA-binding NarL/FixJ family response regulator